MAGLGRQGPVEPDCPKAFHEAWTKLTGRPEGHIMSITWKPRVAHHMAACSVSVLFRMSKSEAQAWLEPSPCTLRPPLLAP